MVFSRSEMFHDRYHNSIYLIQNSNEMKTKVLFFASLMALSFCTSQVQAVNVNPVAAPITKWDVTDPPPGYEIIDLQGTLLYGIDPNSIVAGASDNDVYIGFNKRFGDVNISIYNSMGILVHSTVVNTDVQSVVIIPFCGVTNGIYTVELNNANGSADGDFERD